MERSFGKLTFGDLAVGDKFIGSPLPGDNEHGEPGNPYYIFIKVGRFSLNGYERNSIRLKDGVIDNFNSEFEVIKVE